MLKKWFAVGTIALVGILHLPAVFLDWYFFYWWYDVMMHALGGIATGFFALLVWDWLHSDHSLVPVRGILVQIGFVFGFVAAVGIGWEWAEGLADAFILPRIGFTDAQLGLTDTMFDLYFDLAGGIFAWLVLRALEEPFQA